MAKAIQSLNSGLTVGYAFLGRHGGSRGSVEQQVHDGDTVIIEAAGNLSVRMLGIDTPEVSFPLPNSDIFLGIEHPQWQDFLRDPFTDAPPALLAGLGAALIDYLRQRTGPGCAANHAAHAAKAHKYLEALIKADLLALQQDKENFRFFLAFANEVMDGYGRLLCFLNRQQLDPQQPSPRPRSYNERLLQAGMASAYFIWPNINPFRRHSSLIKAVPTPGKLAETLAGSGLDEARSWVAEARRQGLGIFNHLDPLRLEAFELRLLARRNLPHRWVIDLSNPNTVSLLPPTDYFRIANSEDRLFIPEEYVPLFMARGWQTSSNSSYQ